MARKAYLVDFGLRTRVIADENASDERIAELAAARIKKFMGEEGVESYLKASNLTDIIEDSECPYDPSDDDKED